MHNNLTINPIKFCRNSYIKQYSRQYFYDDNSIERKINSLSDEEFEKFKEAMDILAKARAEQKRFEVFSKKLQCNAGYMDVAQKNMTTLSGTQIALRIAFDDNLIPRFSRAEKSKNTIRAWDKDGKSATLSFFADYKKNKPENLIEQFEIINDENNEPSKVIHTKKSDILKNAFETTEYELKNYDEDINIIKEIKTGNLKGGKRLSWIEKIDNNTVEYSEDFVFDNKRTKRKYRQTTNSKGEIVKSKYSYQIIDEDGKNLLDLNREYIKNSNDKTTTIVNGKKFIAQFDDENKTIQITDDTNKTSTLVVENYCIEEDVEEIYELFKKTDADTLLQIKNSDLRIIHFCSDFLNSYITTCPNGHGYKLVTGDNPVALAHEIGHLVDYSEYKNLRENKEIIKSYNQEWKEFQKNNTIATEELIQYFSQYSFASGMKILGRPTKEDSGLGEFIAEVNVLMKTYNNEEPMNARAMLLVKNFPNTIALVAKNLGY
ncbi:MAG: hypothetical protein IJD57_07085 [Candidatus Gastranaerophilales bacterium]|nr:hypothetical protein [Candidatus Gastranaerophilales bacterium]